MSESLVAGCLGLVEPELEPAVIEAALAACAAGFGETLLIEGQPGPGRTQLLEAALRRARAAGLTVLRVAAAAGTARDLSALAQLTDDPDMSPSGRARLRAAVSSGRAELVGMARPAGARPAGPPATGGDTVAPELAAVLRDLSLETPVVVGVADVEQLDASSRECLRLATRQLRTAAVLFVCSGAPTAAPGAAGAEMPARHQRSLWLGGLSPDGVERLLGDRADTGSTCRARTGAHRTLPRRAFDETGGNPFLLRAWAGECAQPTPAGEAQNGPAAGGGYARAVQALVARLPGTAGRVLAAASVLADQSSADAVATLLGLPPVVATVEVRRLERLGLLADGRFRGEAARAAVYATLDPTVRADLHAGAARLLDHLQVPITVPADHLIACGRVDAETGVRILTEASHDALQADRADEAIRYLRHALAAADGQRRGDLLAALAVAASRQSPAAAEGYLQEALAAARSGQLSDEARETVGGLLIAHGRVGQLRAQATGPAPSGGPAVRSHLSQLWAAASGRPPVLGGPRDMPAQLASGVGLLSASAVWTVPPGSDGGAVAAAERLLEVSPLTDRLLPPVVNAVKVLAFADRVRKAERWCRDLAAAADRRFAVGWRGILAALLAEIMLLQGYCDDGVLTLVEEALAVAQPSSTGLFWVAPMASKVLAHTRAGHYVEASACLDRPPPPAAFSGFDGLGYLRARGHYYLAASYPRAALDDFHAIGRIAADWGVDDPALVPWRLDAAEACLALGLTSEAEDMLAVQAAASPSTNARTRGRTLRLRAATLAPRLRTGPLVQAVEELRRSGDRYELACTYADLGRAYDHAGEPGRAAQLTGKAASLAAGCGAATLAEAPAGDGRPGRGRTRRAAATGTRPLPGPAAGTTAGQPAAASPAADPPRDGDQLSDSERRVVTLAARGFSNRQIANRLAVTVSTVEQHLTRAYRKLGITRRGELPDLVLHLPKTLGRPGPGPSSAGTAGTASSWAPQANR